MQKINSFSWFGSECLAQMRSEIECLKVCNYYFSHLPVVWVGCFFLGGGLNKKLNFSYVVDIPISVSFIID